MEDNKLNVFRKPTIFVGILMSLSALHIYIVHFLKAESSPITKVLPLLMLFFYIFNQQQKSYKHYLLALAVVSCGVGDVILDVAYESYFILGVLFFAVGHCLFISVFKEHFKWNSTKILPIFLLIGIYGYTIITIAPTAGKMLPLLAIYFSLMLILGIVISLNKNINKIALLGVMFFLISDFLFSYHMFVAAIPYRSVWVLSTYYMAHMSLVLGFCHFQRETFIFSTNDKNNLLSSR